MQFYQTECQKSVLLLFCVNSLACSLASSSVFRFLVWQMIARFSPLIEEMVIQPEAESYKNSMSISLMETLKDTAMVFFALVLL